MGVGSCTLETPAIGPVLLETEALALESSRLAHAGQTIRTHLGQKVQKSSMRHNCDVLLFSRPQPHPRLPRPLLNRLARSCPLPCLAIPPLRHEIQIHRLVRELVTQDSDIAAAIAGQVACLLYLWQRDDFHAFGYLHREGVDGGVEGTADGRSNEEVDVGVVREKLGEVATLVFTKQGQGWVGHVVVCSAEVVVALGVADEVDCRGHLEAASGDR